VHPPGLPHRPRRGVRGLCALEPGITLSAIAEPDGALAEKTLRHLTDIDHHHHEAIVALDEPDDAGIGVARFVRDPMRSDTAELAVTVVDEWQGRRRQHGVAGRGQRARVARGIRTFTALMLAGNTTMMTCRASRARPDRRARGRDGRHRSRRP